MKVNTQYALTIALAFCLLFVQAQSITNPLSEYESTLKTYYNAIRTGNITIAEKTQMSLVIRDKIRSFFVLPLKLGLSAISWALKWKYNPNSYKNDFKNLLNTFKSYNLEEHTIETEDGYLLQAFRIIKKKDSDYKNRRAVLFQHGVLDSSDTWLLNDEENIFPFIMIEKGYDVWLGNSRGNKYSFSTKANKDAYLEDSFWDFSWQEMGLYDVPANLEYIINTKEKEGYRGDKKIIYVGHSQGTTQMFAALSDDSQKHRLRVSSLVAAFVAVGPVPKLSYPGGPVLGVLANYPWLVTKLFPKHILLPGFQTDALTKGYCNILGQFPPLNLVCSGGVWTATGDRLQSFTERAQKVFFSHFPSGSSTRNLIHFAQAIRTKKLSKFNYDDPVDSGDTGVSKTSINMVKYGQETPPDYDHSLINVPVLLIVGKGDTLGTERDNKELSEVLGDHLKLHINLDNHAHLSILYGEVSFWKEKVMPLLEELGPA